MRKTVSILISTVVALFAADTVEIDAKIASLQTQIDALKSENGYKVTFPGQYRVNFYSVDNDREGEDRQNAARLRLRQNIDIEFSDRLKSSLRLQLNHTNDNITNAGDVNGNGIQIRHGYIAYDLSQDNNIRAGLVPVVEYHHDLLYSKSWGYNPFALEGFSRSDTLKTHYFAASLTENNESTKRDDIMHYQADITYAFHDNTQMTFSATLLDVNQPGFNGNHYNTALNVVYTHSPALRFHADALYSHSDKGLFSNAKDAHGYTFLAEFDIKHALGSTSLLATHATGNAEGSGFLVPMSYTKTNSYWGYTGIITVMPQTDTGFAGDSVHVSNNGYGMSSLQANARFQLFQMTKLYMALGWFGNTHAPDRDSSVGLDSVIMGQHRFNKYLGLDLGIAYAKIHDSLSGYTHGVIGSTSFNQAAGVTRHKTALFGRLQLEF